MNVETVLNKKGRKIFSIRKTQSVAEAVRSILSNRIGALLVMEGKTLVGILSEKDILSAYNKPSKKTVADIMTPDPIVGLPGDDLHYVMKIMTENRIRHLPIMKDKKVEGMISIGDVVKALLEEAHTEARHLKEYISGKYH